VWHCCEGLSEEKSRGGKSTGERQGRGRRGRMRRGSNAEEQEKWAKLMDGGYYMEG